jgi:alkylhydroperoxidase family enzyme
VRHIDALPDVGTLNDGGVGHGTTPKEASAMAPYLSPVDKPQNPVLKLIYFFSRRQFGKVMAPITVFGARMPASFMSFYGKLPRLDRKLQLPSRTVVLIRERVASINGCLFCMDAARWFAMRELPDSLERLDALPDYKTSPLFTDDERAALDYVTQLVAEKKVEPETFAALRQHYSERQICEIVWLVASEHLYNLTNIGLGIGSDGLCELTAQRQRSSAAAVGRGQHK